MTTRRDILAQATVAALALATPTSLAAFLQRTATDRYLLVELADGTFLAVDMEDRRRAYLLTPNRLRDGTHALSESGAVTVQGGHITGIRGQADTKHYHVEPGAAGTLTITRRDRADLPAVTVRLLRRGGR